MKRSVLGLVGNVRRAVLVPAALAMIAGAASAQTMPGAVDSTAQTAAGGFPDGMRVLGLKGDEIAEVRHRLSGANGAVRQVLVRTGGVAGVRSSLKALPAAALTPQGDSVVVPLTRIELQTLPDAEAPTDVPVAPATPAAR